MKNFPQKCTWTGGYYSHCIPSHGVLYEKEMKAVCLRTTQEVMQQHMPYIFDCWADLVVHLLLLKISMAKLFDQSTCTCFCQVLWALDHNVELSGLVGKGLAIGV